MTRPTRWALLGAILLIAAIGGGYLLGSSTHQQKNVAQSASTAPTTTSAPSSTAESPSSSTTESSKTRSSAPTTTKTKRDRPTTPAPTPVAAPAGTAGTAAVTCPAPTTTVTNAASLTKALSAAEPGAVIHLADGRYDGRFAATTSGTKEQPVWLCGGPGAILDGGSTESGYGFHVTDAQHWNLVGFTIHDSQKGVVVDNSTGIIIQGLTVSEIGDEAIHLRAGTTFSLLRDNTVSGTGMRNKKFGEGIYVGSAHSNWCEYSDCGPDPSNNNAIVSNTISGTSAESIDIKEGSQNGLVQGNTFDGAGGLTGADSWVDVKGNGWTITGNTGKNSPVDGFQVHSVVDGWGMSNVFEDNTADVNGSGYGFHLAPVQNNTVYCNNKASGAAGGLTNTTCV